MLVFFAVLLVAGGVLSFIEPEETFAGVADILGFVFFIIGVFWTIQALAERGMNPMWWIGLISGIALVVLGFWTSGQFFIEKAYTLLVFAGIWALFHGVTDIIRAFQIRAVAKALETIALALALPRLALAPRRLRARRRRLGSGRRTRHRRRAAGCRMRPSRARRRRWRSGSSRRSAGSTTRSTRGEPREIRPGAPPEDVTLYALDQQRIHILLSARPRLARAVLGRPARPHRRARAREHPRPPHARQARPHRSRRPGSRRVRRSPPAGCSATTARRSAASA